MTTSLVILRNDLRLSDHGPLREGAKADRLCIAYIYDESQLGRAQRWWVQESLKALDRELKRRGQKLIVRKGPWKATVEKLAKEIKADTLYWHKGYEPKQRKAEEGLCKKFDSVPMEGMLLIDPEELAPKSSDYYKVYTPFWRAGYEKLQVDRPWSIPKFPPPCRVKSETIKVAGDYSEWWEPGEEGAKKRLRAFVRQVKDYEKRRDRPDLDATSRLSPHLRFGEVSPREVWYAFQDKKATPFLKEIAWREFSYYLLYHFPQLPLENFNKRFDRFPWKDDPAALRRWKEGRTGFPLVDAGMRQLKEMGWMHNRVRMIVASFLTKDLLIHWHHGLKHFREHLLDHDLANNSASWQWTAGCGADAAPFFRIFNPTTALEKFDPDGEYVDRWVEDDLEPMLDHAKARDKALKAYERVKR